MWTNERMVRLDKPDRSCNRFTFDGKAPCIAMTHTWMINYDSRDNVQLTSSRESSMAMLSLLLLLVKCPVSHCRRQKCRSNFCFDFAMSK